jgi:twitching motility two-component system response regulator PilG
MKGTEFYLGILGLSRIERMTVTSVCSLTHSRPRGYTMLPPERSAEAQIMLVDADDLQACRLWEGSSAHRDGRPALMISRDPARVSQQAYVLPRANFASRLLRILDQITVREFKFIPELVISDTPALDSGPGLTATVSVAHIDAPRVLVVDDSMVVRARMRTLLDLHGLQIDLAEDAETALALM